MSTPYPPPTDDAAASQAAESEAWSIAPAPHQPRWSDPVRAAAVRAELARLPGLVTWEETEALRLLLARAAAGEYQVLQAGDGAEDPAECLPAALAREAELLDTLAGMMTVNTGRPVIRIGGVAGRFALPHGSPAEHVGGAEPPVHRGRPVNRPEPDADARRAHAERMLDCRTAARRATEFLRERAAGGNRTDSGNGTDSRNRPGSGNGTVGAPVWTSHEALVLDYELPFLRPAPTGRTLLTSTHLPWLGEHTRRPDGAHARLLARTANPLACEVGPDTTPGDLLRLCAVLDPDREPGRLTLVSRMGASLVASELARLVTAVREAGHPVAWLCDPMRGNTLTARSGRRTRLVSMLIEEVVAFQQAVTEAGGVAAGLRLETTPDPVTECAWGAEDMDRVAERSTSLCGPRLNPTQAFTVTGAWGAPRRDTRS